jgi:acetylornithine deacetylase/succinyl-diaminopimelate desuccinylase-like protein
LSNTDDKKYFSSNKERFFGEWSEYLSFKSISTNPEYNKDCLACFNWLRKVTEKMGFVTEVIETSGKPVLLAIREGSQSLPTLLYYGHYDVQPVGPRELWNSDPFCATADVESDRVYARGAQDNKGQTFYVLKALERLINEGALANTVKLLIEGEEECGSTGLDSVLTSLAPKLSADLLLVCDTGALAADIPMITVGLRGTIGVELLVTGPEKDLHSGVHGGVVKNPAIELVKALSQIHDSTGRIAIPHFYDGVGDVSPAEYDKLIDFPVTEAMYTGLVGIAPTGGEYGLPMAVRRGIRPAIDISGLVSGYIGEGMASIIPGQARVKLGARLVPGQDPAEMLRLIVTFLRERIASECQVEVVLEKSIGGAIRVPLENQWVQLASKVLTGLFKKEAVLCWEGASIPIIAKLCALTGIVPVFVGFGLEEDNIHAPNESFSWAQMEGGFLFVANFMRNLNGK